MRVNHPSDSRERAIDVRFDFSWSDVYGEEAGQRKVITYQ